MNVLVTGANGQLGSEIKELVANYSKLEFKFKDLPELDICDAKSLNLFIKVHNINAVINCAAYTAVDKAEENFEISEQVNSLGVKNLVNALEKVNGKLIHISTDYVFDGTNHKPYLETDTTKPQSVYGKTKLNGELAMKQIKPANSIIIRTSWVYSKFGNNFVKTMLRLAKTKDEISVVFDQIGSPTNAFDLAQAILKILPQIKNKSPEIYHYSNEGVCSWYDFAKAIFEINGSSTKVNKIDSKQYPTAAKRPYYSVLDIGKIKYVYQIKILNWRKSLNNNLNDF